MNIVCAGMPKTCYPYVTFENFKKGLTVPGKLTYKHLKGGVKLIPIDFTIKEWYNNYVKKGESYGSRLYYFFYKFKCNF